MDDSSQSDTLHRKAYEAHERGDFLVALNYYTQAHQLNVGDPNLLLGRAFCLILLKRYEEAAVLYKEVVNRQPTSWRAHSGLGASYLRLRRYQEATDEMTRAIELNPTGGDIDSYLDLAFAYSALQRHDDAASVVEAAVGRGLSHPRLDVQRGHIAHAKGDIEGALDCFRRAEAGAPDDVDITYIVATTAYHLKKFLIARDAFRRVLAKRPDWREALIGLYHSEVGLSNFSEAFAALEKAFSNDPDRLEKVLKEKGRMLGTPERPKGSWSLKRCEPSKS